MTSLYRCKHCKDTFRRSKKTAWGRRFCSDKCFRAGEKVSVWAIWKRDRAICHLCGRYCPLEEASRDHIVPRFYGGRFAFNNLRLAHRSCNSRRGHMSVKEYTDLWEELLSKKEGKRE